MGFFGTLVASWLGAKLASQAKYVYGNACVGSNGTPKSGKPDHKPADKSISELAFNGDGTVRFARTETKVGENGTKMITDL